MPIDKIFGSLNISASGLTAQRKKLDAISSNIANVNSTKSDDGGPYRRRIVVMEENKNSEFQTILRKTSRLATTNPNHISGKRAIRRIGSSPEDVTAKVTEDQSEFKKVYDPGHPDADKDGFVEMPNVNMISEMVDMVDASRSYEANLSAIDAAKKMARAALDI